MFLDWRLGLNVFFNSYCKQMAEMPRMCSVWSQAPHSMANLSETPANLQGKIPRNIIYSGLWLIQPLCELCWKYKSSIVTKNLIKIKAVKGWGSKKNKLIKGILHSCVFKKTHAEYFKAALLIIKPLLQQTWGTQHLLQARYEEAPHRNMSQVPTSQVLHWVRCCCAKHATTHSAIYSNLWPSPSSCNFSSSIPLNPCKDFVYWASREQQATGLLRGMYVCVCVGWGFYLTWIDWKAEGHPA